MQPDPWLGQPLADGRYVVGEKLGEGGMGRVYLARDTRLDITVVIKSPHPVLLSESEFKQRFSREVRTLLKLQHPHIIRVLDFAEHEGVPFAVLEYLPSGSLADQIATSKGARPVESLARWLPHAAEALDYLHERGIVHRDIKPANLFFDENGHVRLGDFGIVKSLRSDKTKTSALTGTGMALGTPEYMAPELALGEDYDGRVDQYALAVTVYEALCGSVPYIGTTSAAVVVAQLSRPPEPLTDRNELVSESLSAVVLKAMSRTANKRFASCGEFAAAVLNELSDRSRSPRVAVVANGVSDQSVGKAPAEPQPSKNGGSAGTVPARNALLGQAPRRLDISIESAPILRDILSQSQPVVGDIAACPACGENLRITPDLAGRKLSCKSCGTELCVSPDGVWLQPRTTTKIDRSPSSLPTMIVPAVNHEPFEQPIEEFEFAPELFQVEAAKVIPPTHHQPTRSSIVNWRRLLSGHWYWIPAAAWVIALGFPLQVTSVWDRLYGIVSRSHSVPNPEPITATITPSQLQSVDVASVSQLPNGTTAGQSNVFRIDNVEYAFRWCPPGTFLMGSSATERDRLPSEDQVDVTLTEGFWMSETEVTQAMWTAVMSTRPWKGQQYIRELRNYPATYVSWNDATAFCIKLTEVARHDDVLSGDQSLSLPTEAQWEYACRAGTKTAYSFGDDPNQLSTYAWWGGIVGDGNAKTERYAHRVGTRASNPWGLSDMHGNVWEWCGDWYDGYLQGGSDPRGPSGGWTRVNRGGSWFDSPQSCRSAFRDGDTPEGRNNYLGFRVVLSSVK